MPSVKAKKVVSTVKRGGSAATNAPARTKAVPKAKNTALKAAAKASRKKEIAPFTKKKVRTIEVPVVVREEPHVLKRDADKPLPERLNDKLRAQLRERRVTNEAAAEALGVHPTYLSRTLREMGEEKVKGATSAHREARAELANAREKFRAQLAKRVNRREMTIEAAAKEAKCTLRTMFRWCAKYATVR